MGLSVANWMKAHPDAIKTGVAEIDQILNVILSSAMLIGGVLGAFLDNTLPGKHNFKLTINYIDCLILTS